MIKTLCRQDRIEWSDHAAKRMLQRGLTRQRVKAAIMDGELIEDYPDDYPYPSCLILGNGIHVVCGIGEGRIWIITSYVPSLDKWEADLRTRKEGKP